jgi:hypothetical protein
MLNTKLNATHYVIVIFMSLVAALAAMMGYGKGNNYGWYMSRDHWNSSLINQIKCAAESKNEESKVIDIKGYKIKVTGNGKDIILNITDSGLTSR